MKETTEENSSKIENLNSDLEKKKREIIDLSEKIRMVELEIKNKRDVMQGSIKKEVYITL